MAPSGNPGCKYFMKKKIYEPFQTLQETYFAS